MCLLNNLRDGVGLEDLRAGLEEGAVAVQVALGRQGWLGAGDGVADRVGDGRDHLSVEHEGCRGVLESFHGELDVLLGDGGELLDARLDQEALETADTGLDEGKQLVGVAGDHAAVEANIDPALVLGSSEFYLEAVKGGGGRDGVQGHVDDGGDTARGCRPRAGRETFPFCAAGLVEVNVGVDKAGDKKHLAVVLVLGRGGETCLGEDLGRYENDLAGDCGDDDGSGGDEGRVIRLRENDSVGDEHHVRLGCRVRTEDVYRHCCVWCDDVMLIWNS